MASRLIGSVARPTVRVAPRTTALTDVQAQAFGARNSVERAQAMAFVEAALLAPDARVIARQNIGGRHINGTQLLELSNGITSIWKPTRGEVRQQVRRYVPVGMQGPREAAAYIVDKRMGHQGRVSPTVIREIEGHAGALSAFVPGARELPAHFRIDDNELSYVRIALLDHVIGNLDRKLGNLVLNANGKLIAIDHGLSFPERNGRQAGSRFIFDDSIELGDAVTLLKGLQNHPTLERELLATGLSASAIDAMYERIDDMVATGHTSNNWRTGGAPTDQTLFDPREIH